MKDLPVVQQDHESDNVGELSSMYLVHEALHFRRPPYPHVDTTPLLVILLCRACVGVPRAHSVSVRGMATEKQIMMRINATKNISKITQSMKMVSAAKLRGDQARLEKAQPFNVRRSQSQSKIVLAFR